MIREHWKLGGIALGFGVLGVVIAILTWHLWVDHQVLHQMADIITRSVQQQQAQSVAPGAEKK